VVTQACEAVLDLILMESGHHSFGKVLQKFEKYGLSQALAA